MSSKRVALAVVIAGTLALAISQPLDDEPRLSVRLWIALTAAALITVLLVRLFTDLPIARGTGGFPSVRQWWLRRRRREPSGTAMGLRAAAGVVARSTENPRTHDNQLRPRLTALADHHVPRRSLGPDRLNELIDAAGDTGWLIDPTITDRAPTVDDIDRFLDRVVDPAAASTTPTPGPA